MIRADRNTYFFISFLRACNYAAINVYLSRQSYAAIGITIMLSLKGDPA